MDKSKTGTHGRFEPSSNETDRAALTLNIRSPIRPQTTTLSINYRDHLQDQSARKPVEN